MNLLLIALGSHGDVHPFVGMALRLRERGHRAVVAANGHFKPLIEGLGLEFKEVGTDADYRRLTANPALWQAKEGFRVIFTEAMVPMLRPMYEMVRDFASAHPRSGPDRAAVVASSLGIGARVAQDKLEVPTMSVHLAPTLFRSLYDTPIIAGSPIGPGGSKILKRLAFWIADRLVIDPMIAPPLNALRRELGLPRVTRVLRDWVHSPECTLGLFAPWFASPQRDWPKQVRLTGFPLYDERGIEPMSDDLKRFLADGSPPIAFTPGSAMWHGGAFFEAAVAACQLLGRRGLLLTRHRAHVPAALGKNILHVPFAPFSDLLPKCAALVHHGGIGTSSQAMCAGVPQVVMPMGYDQPDNAARMRRLGIARSITPRAFTGLALAEQLASLLGSAEVLQACSMVAAKFAGVDGLGAACDLVERLGA